MFIDNLTVLKMVILNQQNLKLIFKLAFTNQRFVYITNDFEQTALNFKVI